MEIKIRIILGLTLATLLIVFFTNCKGKNSQDTFASTSVDPWDTPVSTAVDGVDYYEGWEDLRLLAFPPNVDGGWTDSVHISTNGRSLYFGYNKQDFWTFITTFTQLF
ncbi:MAG: hypothetical protein IPM57_06620 [Oligoflexia bacterium]|nr:hypothetical protein [Oligoflexia bacterium]